MLYPNLKRVLNELSNEVIKDYREGLLEKKPHRNGKGSYDKYASGELFRSTDCIVKETLTGYEVYFSAAKQWINVEDGRREGAWCPVIPIKKWVLDRNIESYGDVSEESLPYVIARGIEKYGIVARPILGDIQKKLMDNWSDRIIEAARIDIVFPFIESFKTDVFEHLSGTITSNDKTFMNINIKTN